MGDEGVLRILLQAGSSILVSEPIEGVGNKFRKCETLGSMCWKVDHEKTRVYVS